MPTTTKAKQRSLPPMPGRPAAHDDIQHVFCDRFLERDAATARIAAMRDAEWRRNKWTDTPKSQALAVAWHSLTNEAAQALHAALQRG
ncbi:MAG: hypothetical protein CTY21_13470, partial [Methylomonas sp.]